MEPNTPLRKEIYYFQRAIDRNILRKQEYFDRDFPSCCHWCAYPELNRIQEKLDRQQERLKSLYKKLNEDVGSLSKMRRRFID